VAASPHTSSGETMYPKPRCISVPLQGSEASKTATEPGELISKYLIEINDAPDCSPMYCADR